MVSKRHKGVLPDGRASLRRLGASARPAATSFALAMIFNVLFPEREVAMKRVKRRSSPATGPPKSQDTSEDGA